MEEGKREGRVNYDTAELRGGFLWYRPLDGYVPTLAATESNREMWIIVSCCAFSEKLR